MLPMQLGGLLSISDQTRKKLWGRSGNRCAMCDQTLTSMGGVDVVVGRECHIVARASAGPRGRLDAEVDLDSYENLILLCANHHALIDANEEIFTREIVLEIKKSHEERVRAALEPDAAAQLGLQGPVSAQRIQNGTELARLAAEANCHLHQHDHPDSQDESDSIRTMLQDFVDWTDVIALSGQPSAAIDAANALDEHLRAVERHGFVVVGALAPYLHPPGVTLTAAVLVITKEWEAGSNLIFI